MELTPQIKHWINNRVAGSVKRARNKRPADEWRRAIKKTVARSDGYCPYTGVKLDFSRDSADPFYPSLDHKKGVDSTDLEITNRLVNDMKSIMTEEEFNMMVEHICAYRRLKPRLHKSLTIKSRY